MERECLGDAVGRDALGEQRIIGGVIDRVGETQDGEHRDEHPEGMDQSGDRDCAGAQQQAGDQIDARPGAIDEETDRRLQRRTDHGERGECEPELGVAHLVIRADEDEQRGNEHHVIVAHQVRHAHAGDEFGLARPARAQDVGGLDHVGWRAARDHDIRVARACVSARQTR